MRSSKLLLAILMLLPLMQLFGCGGGGGGGVPAVPVLVSITVTPANPTIAINTVVQFTATATYSNNTAIDVTANATWSSSNPAVATVSDTTGSKGSANGVAAGSTTITASYGGQSGATTLTVTGTGGGGNANANVMTVSVNGSLCSPFTSQFYFNKPCVSVTVCVPNDPTNCTTINDLLLDTGSYGLRIFKQTATNGLGLPAALAAQLPQVASGSGSLVGCVEFADGTSLWGPVRKATVILGNEPGVTVPIQVVDSSFAPATNCGVPDDSPVRAGFTGILGVGVHQQDCGQDCASSAMNGMYYSCAGGICNGAAVPLTDQVANPVAALSQDNNGVIVQLPFVPPGGVPSVTGSMILGIGTQADNAPGSPVVIPTDSRGYFTTVFFNGVSNVTFNDSFLDTGSNANFIPNVAPTILPPCTGANSEWYCPPVTRALFATITGSGGAPSTPVAFSVGNALALFGTNNEVLSNIAGTSTFGFDWGMPFHLGRSVLYGYEGRSTPSLNATGPFVGF